MNRRAAYRSPALERRWAEAAGMRVIEPDDESDDLRGVTPSVWIIDEVLKYPEASPGRN